MMGYNGAAFVSDKENKEIVSMLDRFTNKTNMPLVIQKSTFKCGGFYDPIYEGRQTGFIINGKEFRKEPCVESWGGYVNRIQSYLFNLLMED